MDNSTLSADKLPVRTKLLYGIGDAGNAIINSAVQFFLLVFNIAFVPAVTWWRVFKGFFSFGSIPPGADWLLLGAFAAYSGAGGMGNIWTASWLRDKG